MLKELWNTILLTFLDSVFDQSQHGLHSAEIPDQELLLSVHVAGERVEQEDAGALDETVDVGGVFADNMQQDAHQTLVLENLWKIKEREKIILYEI